MSVQYHLQQPESTADSYLPFQGIDFVLSTPGRKLVANSVRIEGRIVARTNTTDPYTPATAGDASSAVDYASNVKIDNIVGAHSFFDSFTCETQTKGVLENLQNYPRFVAQHGRATYAPDDMLSSKLLAEARGPVEENGNYVLQPIVDQSFVSGATEQPSQRSVPSFSLKPMVCFNRSAGGEYSFDRGGFIRISTILAADRHALFGGADGANYVLTDVVCRYVTIADDGKDEPMLMRSYVNVVSSMQSTATTVSAKVPSQQVSSVSMSFAKQTNIQSTEFNSLALESIPAWDSVEYLFANSLQNFITYRITDEGDALERGLEAMESAGHSMVSAKTLKANKGMLMGLNFKEYVDLSRQAFTINLKILDSTITQNAFDIFLFFNSLIQL
tara:strand:+ start:718 stop:1881 length:1164 start_codon:yes stop_codon:yes gene_type:complete